LKNAEKGFNNLDNKKTINYISFRMNSRDKNTDKMKQIADGFEKHFNHFGFQKTSVDAVAKDLGMSKKTIYQLFSTKEEIFYFIVSRIAMHYCRSMEKKLQKIPSGLEQLLELIQMIFRESRKWLKQNDAFEFRYKQDIASLAFKDAYGKLFQNLLEKIKEERNSTYNNSYMLIILQGIITEAQKHLAENPDRNLEEEILNTVESMFRK